MIYSGLFLTIECLWYSHCYGNALAQPGRWSTIVDTCAFVMHIRANLHFVAVSTRSLSGSFIATMHLQTWYLQHRRATRRLEWKIWTGSGKTHSRAEQQARDTHARPGVPNNFVMTCNCNLLILFIIALRNFALECRREQLEITLVRRRAIGFCAKNIIIIISDFSSFGMSQSWFIIGFFLNNQLAIPPVQDVYFRTFMNSSVFKPFVGP